MRSAIFLASAGVAAAQTTAQCSGAPCSYPTEVYCRSEWGFCGAGDAYCNDRSTWTAQTGGEGEPCEQACRSEFGYCDIGPEHCNDASVWVPECVDDEEDAKCNSPRNPECASLEGLCCECSS